MSLRQRFVLLVCLAVVALGAAGLAIVQLRSGTSAALERAAVEHGEDAVDLMLRTIDGAPAITPEARPGLQGSVAGLVAPLGDASAGYCTGGGTIELEASGPRFHAWAAQGAGPYPRGGRPPFGRPGDHGPDDRGAGGDGTSKLLPLDREAVTDLCRDARRERTIHARVAAPQDVLILSARAAGGGLVAWVLVAVPPARSDGAGAGWITKIGVMGLATLLLVGLAVDALAALRRGATDLEVGLLRLQDDLRAEIPRPRARELARIAIGVRSMASHLADAQERERALERRLGHEQRLAGLGRVVAGVAHEVRNPLTGIKLKLDTMARRRLDDRSARDVAICLQEIGRLDRVVSTLLVVSRKAPTEVVAIDLAALVDERLAQASALARAREVRLARGGAATAFAHRESLSRVIDNLVRNAVEASPPSTEVRVILTATASEARLDVVDHGGGIPEHRLPELFEPFFTLKPDGTGLGLFLSRSLLEAQGGHLAYARDDGVTRFTVTLPLETTHAEAAARPDR
jgi:signal transduction histidine kinase